MSELRSLWQLYTDRIVLVILVVFSVILLWPRTVVYASSASYSFSPSSGSYSGCNSHTISLILSVSGSSNAADVEFRYDPNSVDINSIDSPGSNGFLVKQINNGDVKLAKGYFISPLSGQETYATITFTPHQNATVGSFIVIGGSVADNDTSEDIPTSYGSASFSLHCTPPAPPPAPPPNPTPAPSPNPSPNPSPTPSPQPSPNPSGTPNPSPSPVPSGNPSPSNNPSSSSGGGTNPPNTSSSSGSPAKPGTPPNTPLAAGQTPGQTTGPQITIGDKTYAFNDDLPPMTLGASFTLTGEAAAGGEVTITVNSNPLIFNTVAGADGKWMALIKTDGLEAGEHSYRIHIKDSKGVRDFPLVKFTLNPVTAISLTMMLIIGGVLVLVSAGLWLFYSISKEIKHREQHPVEGTSSVKPSSKAIPASEPKSKPLPKPSKFLEIEKLEQDLSGIMMGAIDQFTQTWDTAVSENPTLKPTPVVIGDAWKVYVELLGAGFEELGELKSSVAAWIAMRGDLAGYSEFTSDRTLASAMKKLEKLKTELQEPENTSLLASAGNIAYSLTDELRVRISQLTSAIKPTKAKAKKSSTKKKSK